MYRDIKKRKADCKQFFNELAKEIGESYEIIGSCNRDDSAYLIPKGTEKQISYYGKPDRSFRYSDHWNWYSSIKKCSDENIIQCYNADIPMPRDREAEGKASKPRFVIQVGYCDKNNEYVTVYGEMFDKENNQWTWIENDPKEVAKNLISKESE